MEDNLLLQEAFGVLLPLFRKRTKNFTIIDREKEKIEQFFTPGTLSTRLPD